MSDLNDDLLNYELGDDIDDQALYGADEDELLLSDEELEKDVTKEEKQQLKAEAEHWVKSQMQAKLEVESDLDTATSTSQEAPLKTKAATEPSTLDVEYVEVAGEVAAGAVVTSTAPPISIAIPNVLPTLADDVSTSVKTLAKPQSEFKSPAQMPVAEDQPELELIAEPLNDSTSSNITVPDEVTSSSSKELDLDRSPVISCSTNNHTDSPSYIQSSQESSSIGTAGLASSDFSDPREDFEEEREERTNIKITNEREMHSALNEPPPEKPQGRFMHGKRGGNPMLRPHQMRPGGGPSYHNRPLLRFPPHGQFPTQQAHNHPYAPHTSTHAPLMGPSGPGGGPGPQQSAQNPNTQNSPSHMHMHPHQHQQHPHDPMNHPNHPNNNNNHLRPRHPSAYPPGFRPGGPNGPMSGYRHPNPNAPGMYGQVPPEYVQPPFGPNFGHPSRSMFRHEHPPRGPPMGHIPGGLRPLGMRMRPPLQNLTPPHNMAPNYVNGPPMRHQQHMQSQLQPPPPTSVQQQPTPQQQQGLPQQASLQLSLGPAVGGATSGQGPAGSQQAPLVLAGATLAPGAMRPGKVLINPNFKGGVEAATNKFIKETQMAISNHVAQAQRPSDAELLRQQEEFINKNRQHIEKRRHERLSPPPVASRRTRSRSHSRDRSYTPPSKRSGCGGGIGGGVNIGGLSDRHFERERDRDRAERFAGGRGGSRDRCNRDRSAAGGGTGRGVNRFRRGNSRDRDYENRNSAGGAGSKRRRSASPLRSAGARRGERDRNELEEDEETRVYRLEIEKQKAMREKVMRDKEMKRRRAAEEKLHEDKRSAQSTNNSSSSNNNNSNSNGGNNSNKSHDSASNSGGGGNNNSSTSKAGDEQQRSGKNQNATIMNDRKVSFKRRQQPKQQEQRVSQPQPKQSHSQSSQSRSKQPTAKIMPEAKRTLNEHLTHAASSATSGGGGGSGVGVQQVRSVQKNETHTPPPPVPPVQAQPPKTTAAPQHVVASAKNTRHLSTPSDDEVELDYDEDELMLEEEDRLLATPTPSPPVPHVRPPVSRTPTPEPPPALAKAGGSNSHSHSHSHRESKSRSGGGSGERSSHAAQHKLAPFSNRRVVFKTSSSSTSRRDGKSDGAGEANVGSSGRSSRHGGNSSSSQRSSGDSSRKGIFDRLDVRKQQQLQQQQQQHSSSEGKQRKGQHQHHQQRVMLKHD